MIEYALKAVNEAAKIPFPIGYLNQAINSDRNSNLHPGIIPASIFFQKDGFGLIPKNDGDFDAISFDLLVSESHVLDFDVSDHAVENGTVVSDHVIQKLRSITVSGLFTNHSISRNAYVKDGKIVERDSVELVDIKASENGTVEGSTNRCLEMWENLLKLARQKKKVRLVTSLEVYDEMVIESVSADRGPDDGDAIKFSLRLRELKTSRVEKKSITGVWEPPQPAKLDEPKKKAVSKKNKGGKKTAQAVDVDAEANRLYNMKQPRTYTGGQT